MTEPFQLGAQEVNFLDSDPGDLTSPCPTGIGPLTGSVTSGPSGGELVEVVVMIPQFVEVVVDNGPPLQGGVVTNDTPTPPVLQKETPQLDPRGTTPPVLQKEVPQFDPRGTRPPFQLHAEKHDPPVLQKETPRLDPRGTHPPFQLHATRTVFHLIARTDVNRTPPPPGPPTSHPPGVTPPRPQPKPERFDPAKEQQQHYPHASPDVRFWVGLTDAVRDEMRDDFVDNFKKMPLDIAFKKAGEILGGKGEKAIEFIMHARENVEKISKLIELAKKSSEYKPGKDPYEEGRTLGEWIAKNYLIVDPMHSIGGIE